MAEYQAIVDIVYNVSDKQKEKLKNVDGKNTIVIDAESNFSKVEKDVAELRKELNSLKTVFKSFGKDSGFEDVDKQISSATLKLNNLSKAVQDIQQGGRKNAVIDINIGELNKIIDFAKTFESTYKNTFDEIKKKFNELFEDMGKSIKLPELLSNENSIKSEITETQELIDAKKQLSKVLSDVEKHYEQVQAAYDKKSENEPQEKNGESESRFEVRIDKWQEALENLSEKKDRIEEIRDIVRETLSSPIGEDTADNLEHARSELEDYSMAYSTLTKTVGEFESVNLDAFKNIAEAQEQIKPSDLSSNEGFVETFDGITESASEAGRTIGESLLSRVKDVEKAFLKKYELNIDLNKLNDLTGGYIEQALSTRTGKSQINNFLDDLLKTFPSVEEGIKSIQTAFAHGMAPEEFSKGLQGYVNGLDEIKEKAITAKYDLGKLGEAFTVRDEQGDAGLVKWFDYLSASVSKYNDMIADFGADSKHFLVPEKNDYILQIVSDARKSLSDLKQDVVDVNETIGSIGEFAQNKPFVEIGNDIENIGKAAEQSKESVDSLKDSLNGIGNKESLELEFAVNMPEDEKTRIVAWFEEVKNVAENIQSISISPKFEVENNEKTLVGYVATVKQLDEETKRVESSVINLNTELGDADGSWNRFTETVKSSTNVAKEFNAEFQKELATQQIDTLKAKLGELPFDFKKVEEAAANIVDKKSLEVFNNELTLTKEKIKTAQAEVKNENSLQAFTAMEKNLEKIPIRIEILKEKIKSFATIEGFNKVSGDIGELNKALEKVNNAKAKGDINKTTKAYDELTSAISRAKEEMLLLSARKSSGNLSAITNDNTLEAQALFELYKSKHQVNK